MSFMLCFFAFITGILFLLAGAYRYRRYLGGECLCVWKRIRKEEQWILIGFILYASWHWRERLYSFSGVISYGVFLCLLLIAWIDFCSMIIPNELNLILLILGILYMVIYPDYLSLWERFLGLFIISLPLAGINVIYPGGFGGGDVKLVAAGGFYLGWKSIAKAVTLGSFFAAGMLLFLIFIHKITVKDKVAFGPYLCAGMLWVLL